MDDEMSFDIYEEIIEEPTYEEMVEAMYADMDDEYIYAYGEYRLSEFLEYDHFDNLIMLAEGRDKGELIDAIEWAMMGADRGEKTAATRLGEIFSKGICGIIGKDDELAFYFYNIASKCGSPHGSKACAIAYEEGKGVGVDLAMARSLYEKAELEFDQYYDDEDPEVDFRLGRLIYYGLGGDADREEGGWLMETSIDKVSDDVLHNPGTVSKLLESQLSEKEKEEWKDFLVFGIFS